MVRLALVQKQTQTFVNCTNGTPVARVSLGPGFISTHPRPDNSSRQRPQERIILTHWVVFEKMGAANRELRPRCTYKQQQHAL